MVSQGHKEVDEANKATLRATGVTPKMRQVIDPRARSDLYDPYAIQAQPSKYVVWMEIPSSTKPGARKEWILNVDAMDSKFSPCQHLGKEKRLCGGSK